MRQCDEMRGRQSPTRGFQDEFTLAAERPSARLPNDETECMTKRASVCEERSLDSIFITDNGLLGLSDAWC